MAVDCAPITTLIQFNAAIKAAGFYVDDAQKAAIEAPADAGLFIVAGPGAGKTTCIFLRVMKLVLADGIPPAGIIATTFTRKAAEELRSRILGKGFEILEHASDLKRISKATKNKIEALDINQIWTGTLDQLCEELLRDHRIPGKQPPVVFDDFISKTLMLRKGLRPQAVKKGHPLDEFFKNVLGAPTFSYGQARRTEMAMSLWGRRYQDLVKWPELVEGENESYGAISTLHEVFEGYAGELERRGAVDFALLEYRVLEYLRDGNLSPWLSRVRVLLVDEYQDTNPLQEEIYFSIASATNGALYVVGDDDQSLYRFRGATVELFRDFVKRYQRRFKRKPERVFLSVNYRSTASIVKFVNDFAELDYGYQSARVKGKPPMLLPKNAQAGLPVLGMFRSSREELAQALSDFIRAVFRGKGYRLKDGRLIHATAQNADFGDCALLCSSPRESKENGELRLPGLLREKLANASKPIQLFNPRGHDFHELPDVARFGGLIVDCLDPDGAVYEELSQYWRESERQILEDWRIAGADWISEAGNSGVRRYVENWQHRNPRGRGRAWPKNTNILQLIYGLMHFFPELHDSPEGQVCLEVFVRQTRACEELGGFRGRVVHDSTNPELSTASIRALLTDFIRPIVSGLVQIDDAMMESFPRDRLSVMSIHQSKGLQFPLTIVDISSDFARNHHAQKSKRFPEGPSASHLQEDFMRTYSSIRKEERSGRDRAFDDLIRQYFVAFSRAEDVLLLVGLSKSGWGGTLENVASGWDRRGAQTESPIWMI